MAINGLIVTSAVLGEGQGTFPGSQQLPLIASAVGTAVATWMRLPSNVVLQGVTVGVVGSGVVNGKLFVAGGAVLVVAALQEAGVAGPTSVGLGKVVGAGVVTAITSSAQYIGTSVGVSVGSDTSKVVFANALTLVTSLYGNLLARGMSGSVTPLLAKGLGNGISSLVATGYGLGGVSGAPSPTAGLGTSVGSVL